MKYLKLPCLILAFAIAALLYGIVRGGILMREESSSMREKCMKTDLYVISDKGHRNRIYDCSGVEL